MTVLRVSSSTSSMALSRASRASLGAAVVILGCITAAQTAMASPPCTIGQPDCVLDGDGAAVDADAAYRDTVARARPNWLRAGLEEAFTLGAGTAWYWIDRERQVADWDFPSLKQRFTFEAWRLDSNPFPINFFGHAFNGAGFHTIARSNDLPLVGALGVGFATSMVWEYALEFREKISINDVILTPVAGLSGGEFFHWLGRYLDGGPAAARWALTFPHALHRQLDGPYPGRPRSIWHRFRLAYRYSVADIDPAAAAAPDQGAVGVAEDSAQVHGVELFGRLVALPGYARPGRQTRWFREGNVTSMHVQIASADGDPAVDVLADTIVLGWLRQSGDRSAILGLGVAYRYRKQTIAAWHDRLGVVHLPGLAVDGDLLVGDWRVHARARFNGDFAGIHGLPFKRWRDAADPDLVAKTILRKHGYYYGWGLSTRAHVELIGPRLQLGASLYLGRYVSQEGLDRAQEDITADLEADDRVVELAAWARVKPLEAGYFLDLRTSFTGRRSELDTFSDDQDLRLHSISLGAEF